jgi:Rrf2 family transcriptional regulator, iron-sulfur cluster assembly transcription factor
MGPGMREAQGMKISSSAYFAVESLARLAACGPDRPCPTESLARSINRSVSFTVQLMAELRAAGLVKATRGPRRGYYLNKPAHRITVAEVFRAFGEPHTLEDRPFAPRDLSDSDIDELGGTHLLWEALNSYILLSLEGVSLADIAPATDEASSDRMGHRLH